MAMRFRYFPAFLAVAFLGLLCIPIYYVDLWSNGITSRVTSDVMIMSSQQDAAAVADANADDRWRRQQQREGPPFIVVDSSSSNDASGILRAGSSTGNDIYERDGATPADDQAAVAVAVAVPPRPLPIRPPLQMSNGEVVRRNYNVVDPYGVDLVSFALRLAKDRLRIEKYGPASLRRLPMVPPPLIDANDFANESEVQTTTTTTAASATISEVAANATDVIIVTYFRGGTTFFGDLLNEYPGTFYHFEPLHRVTQNDQVRTDDDIIRSMYILRRLLRCDYGGLSDYVNYVREPDHRFLFEHNRRLWFTCQFHSALCYNRRFLTSMCRLHPIHVTKLVRLRLAHAKQLMDEFPALKVIYLVRDPRGLYSSRRDLGWCNLTQSCIDPYSYCEDMRQDIAVAAQLKSTMPDRFLAVRYEDMSIDTENQVSKVLDFLGLDPHPRLKRFIMSHTKLRAGENSGGPYSTRRDSKKAPFLWKRKLSADEIAYVEDACPDVIKRLNFT